MLLILFYNIQNKNKSTQGEFTYIAIFVDDHPGVLWKNNVYQFIPFGINVPND